MQQTQLTSLFVFDNVVLFFVTGLWLVIVSFVSFTQFWWDKRQSLRSGQRISERNLLIVAVLGGYLGAKSGQRLFRHKTYKQPFGAYLNLLGALMFGVFALVLTLATHR